MEQSTMRTACPWAWVTEHHSCAAATVEDIMVGKVEEWVIRECLRCLRLVPASAPGAVEEEALDEERKRFIAGELLDLAAYHERLLDTWTHRFSDEANRQAPTPDLLAGQRRALEEPELNDLGSAIMAAIGDRLGGGRLEDKDCQALMKALPVHAQALKGAIPSRDMKLSMAKVLCDFRDRMHNRPAVECFAQSW